MKKMPQMAPVTMIATVSTMALALVMACAPQSRFRAAVVKDGKIQLEEAKPTQASGRGVNRQLPASENTISKEFALSVEEAYVLQSQVDKITTTFITLELKDKKSILLRAKMEDGKTKATISEVKEISGRYVEKIEQSRVLRGELKCEESDCQNLEATVVLNKSEEESKKSGDELKFKLAFNVKTMSAEGAELTPSEGFSSVIAEELSKLQSVKRITDVLWTDASTKRNQSITLVNKDSKEIIGAVASGKDNEKVETLAFEVKRAMPSLLDATGSLVKKVSMIEADDSEKKNLVITLVDKNEKAMVILMTAAADAKPAEDTPKPAEAKEDEPTLKPSAPVKPGETPGHFSGTNMNPNTQKPTPQPTNTPQIGAAPKPTQVEKPKSQGSFAEAKSGGSPSIPVKPSETPGHFVGTKMGPVTHSKPTTNPTKVEPPKSNGSFAEAKVGPVAAAANGFDFAKMASNSELYCTYQIRNEPNSMMEVYFNQVAQKVVMVKVNKSNSLEKELIRVDQGKRVSNYIQAKNCMSEVTFIKNGSTCADPFLEMRASVFAPRNNQCSFAQKNSGTNVTVSPIAGNKAELDYGYTTSAVTGPGIGQGFFKFEVCAGPIATFVDGQNRTVQNKPLEVFALVNPSGASKDKQCAIGLDLAAQK
jgi:hypothetical protein